MNVWAASSMEENNATITRAATELFYRHRDMRSMILSQKEIIRDLKTYKIKAEVVDEEMKEMANAHALEAAKVPQLSAGWRKSYKMLSRRGRSISTRMSSS